MSEAARDAERVNPSRLPTRSPSRSSVSSGVICRYVTSSQIQIYIYIYIYTDMCHLAISRDYEQQSCRDVLLSMPQGKQE